jgi:hypothetical protein
VNALRFEENYGLTKALLLEPGATNKCTQSRNFGSWSTVGAPTEAQDQSGIDGTSNTAWTLGDTSDSVFESEYFAITVTDDSTVHCASAFVEKSSDTSRFPAIGLVFVGGTQVNYRVHVNTSTGATLSEGTDAPTAYGIEDHGTYWRAWVPGANNSSGNTTARIYLWPARGTVLGTGTATATGTAVFDAAQVELNTKYPTSFIPTAGSEVSRTTEAGGLTWTLPTGIFTGTKPFTVIALASLGAAEADFASANHSIVSVRNSATSVMYVNTSGDFAISDGTNSPSKDVNVARLTRYKIATKADATPEISSGAVAASSAWTSSAWGTAAVYDGDMTVGANLLLGQTTSFPMWIEKVWIFNRVLNDAEINLLR